MWHKPKLLNMIANLLFGASFGIVLYVVSGYAFNEQTFPLKVVNITGQLKHLTRDQIQLVVDKKLSRSFFGVDLDEAHDAFQNLEWVRKVSVRRHWPDQIDVAIEEHRPLAKWGEEKLISTRGKVFNVTTKQTLPIFIAPNNRAKDVTRFYDKFGRLLNKADLHIKTLELTDRNAWHIETVGGMTIQIGRLDIDARMHKFLHVYKSTIAGLNKKISYVDLRYQNGFAIRKPLKAKKQKGS